VLLAYAVVSIFVNRGIVAAVELENLVKMVAENFDGKGHRSTIIKSSGE
jgi:hypothetical protein